MGYYAITPNLMASGNINVACFVKQDVANPDAAVQCGLGDTAIGVSASGTNTPPGVVGSTTLAAAAGQPCVIYPALSTIELQIGSVGVVPGPLKPDVNGYGIQANPGDFACALAFVTGAANEFIRVYVLPQYTRVAASGSGGLLTVTTNTVLTAANVSQTVFANAADLVITLPAASTTVGGEIRVISLSAGGSTGTSVSMNGTDQMVGNGFTPANGKGAVNTHATAVVGDSLTLKSDGVSKWYIISMIGNVEAGGLLTSWARQS